MDSSSDLLLCLAVAAVAWLYSSVGHAGASGYIAVMTLAGFAPDRIKPLALLLNVLVASIASVQFYRAGHFSWNLFWPIALLSAPMAFFGGYLSLPLEWFRFLLGAALAGWFFMPSIFTLVQGNPSPSTTENTPDTLATDTAEVGLWDGVVQGIDQATVSLSDYISNDLVMPTWLKSLFAGAPAEITWLVVEGPDALDVRDAALLRAMGLRPNAKVRLCRLGEPCIVEVMTGAGDGTCKGPGGCWCRIGLAKPLAGGLEVEETDEGPHDCCRGSGC